MKLTSLLGLSLELLEIVATSGPLPADARVGRFFRARRYLGSQDRRFLSSVVYTWLRRSPEPRLRWKAWRRRAHPGEDTAHRTSGGGSDRLRLIADLVVLAREERLPGPPGDILHALRELMQGEKVMDPLLERVLEDPRRIGDDLPGEVCPTDGAERLAAELCLPAWLASRLTSERGENAARTLAEALLANACVDLRVQTTLCSRQEALRRLESETGATPVPTPWSPRGLRLAKRLNLGSSSAYREGWVEVADEGTQLVVLALEPEEGSTVIDACAGAGGKTLALADLLLAPQRGPDAASPSPPRLLACDISTSRLDELARRALRAGVHRYLEIIPLSDPETVPGDMLPADLVLIDAPCSGLGTLRRNPDLKLRHGPEDIARFHGAQRDLLERWAPLVRSGGRLAYVTCSILRAENEEVAGEFGARHPEFTVSSSRWAEEHLPGECLRGGYLHLDPVVPGTDGFFLALWRRR